MTWIPNSAPRVGWLFALCGLYLLVPGLWSSTPAHADDSEPGQGELPPDTPSAEVEAALRAHLEARELVVFQRAAGDFDRDGLVDIVAHVARPPESALGERDDDDDDASASALDARSALVVVVGDRKGRGRDRAAVIVDVADGMLCPYCAIGEQEQTRSFPEQSLRVADGRIEMCESWGTAWYARECSWLQLDGGVLRVASHHELTGWTQGPGERSNGWDFLARTGERAYLALPTETGFPPLSRETRFALLTAAHEVSEDGLTLDGELDEPGWQRAEVRHLADASWLTSGEAFYDDVRDLSVELRLLWRDDALWIGVDITDDVAVRGACVDGHPLAGDRVELWFDLARDLRVEGNDEHVETHRRVYLEDAVRHEPDEGLSLLVVAPVDGEVTACARRELPRAELGAGKAHDETTRPRTAAANSARVTGVLETVIVPHDDDGGYRAEIRIPASFFGADDLDEFAGRWYGVGLTVLAHDVDAAERPQDATDLATSSLRWGDPFSVGLLVMPDDDPELPSFPFDWASWLE